MHYRIEQRRSVYVTTDILPSQWDTQQLNHILDLAEVSEVAGAQQRDMRIRPTRSMPDRPILVLPEAEPKSPVDVREARRASAYNRRGVSKADIPMRLPNTPPSSPHRASPRTPTRARILFYHKHDPHYGFTNFSPHPVMYDGKLYPTSEHLFQSFKVTVVSLQIYYF
jgi:diaminohydroxyphosphoribosylaminopyrimidine deaminase/5-amino-6-(5-phosphoribosylamino)uracil reductase